MKYIINSLLALLSAQFLSAQDHEVQVHAHETDTELTFYGVNESMVRQDVTLTLTLQNLEGYDGPISASIPARDSIQLIQFSLPKNEHWYYETNYTYLANPTEEENKRLQQQVKQELFEFLDTENNPVIVFYMEGCAASAYAKELLEKKRIPFKYLESDNNKHNHRMMWELVKIQDPGTKEVGFPVFLVNEKLDHDIKNLRWYIKELASK